MRRRVAAAILLLYPRRVRKGHGPEIVALVEDLVTHEGRSSVRLFVRLAVDGLVQRVASTATVWTAVAVLAATSFGGLAVSDFAAASAHQDAPRPTGAAVSAIGRRPESVQRARRARAPRGKDQRSTGFRGSRDHRLSP
jgi:hypothetical protein